MQKTKIYIIATIAITTIISLFVLLSAIRVRYAQRQQDRAIAEMYERVGIINSTIDLNSDEWNRLQEELDEEIERIREEQQALHDANQQLREEKKSLQKQLTNDPQLVEGFMHVSDEATQN